MIIFSKRILKYRITSFNSINTLNVFDMRPPSNISLPALYMVKFF